MNHVSRSAAPQATNPQLYLRALPHKEQSHACRRSPSVGATASDLATLQVSRPADDCRIELIGRDGRGVEVFFLSIELVASLWGLTFHSVAAALTGAATEYTLLSVAIAMLPSTLGRGTGVPCPVSSPTSTARPGVLRAQAHARRPSLIA